MIWKLFLGGKSLFKNTCQLNYFNYDNMCYRQVYNRGPLEEREPLYHSDPSFIAFNPILSCNQIYGLFIDNPSQVLMDITYSNSKTYMLGVRFGDLDYYVTLGTCVAEITTNYSRLIGTSRLKPRYALGYHQGCYGYENRGALEYVVQKYRDYRIPLDGLHVDVDIQYNYQTFTIDEGKFPNPKEMFDLLRRKGVKCSTNITPIISKNDEYRVYREGKEKGYFVMDERANKGEDFSKHQDYNGGYEETSHWDNYHPGEPFYGEVYYGGNRGTVGHYPDFARKEVCIVY
jgi:alpha-glucosidase